MNQFQKDGYLYLGKRKGTSNKDACILSQKIKGKKAARRGESFASKERI